jgi:thymidylate synthase ThyX
MDYPSDQLTPAERERIAPHVTHLDRPVFGLVNLPETVKGAMFARYSRYDGTLRRLFLDEFADSLPSGPAAAWDQGEGDRAAALYERIFLGYGDDSVAQLGGMHVACEWVSNVLTKVLQRPRLAAYLEQSTRYIRYDGEVPGLGHRYFRDPALGPEYPRAMDALFGAYARSLPRVRAWVDAEFPGERGPARDRAVGAKALDLLRGLLPAASLSHMGIYASGQTYEQLILHLMAHPLPEARRYGRWLLDAVQAVMPSFVARVERPDRGGEWIGYLESRDRSAARWVTRLGLDRPTDAAEGRPSVRLLHVDGDEEGLLAALLFEASGVSEEDARIRLSALSGDERAELLSDLVGLRANRRHRPGAASRCCATGSRSSRTTAPSATCSATACSPSSGRASGRSSARACPTRSTPRAAAGTTGGRSSSPSASSAAWWPRDTTAASRSTPSASASGSGTSWTSTPARRCSSSSCARAARGIPRIAPSPTRCTAASARSIPRWRPP